MLPTKSDFENALEEIFRDAEAQELIAVEIVSGDLHQKLGGYTDSNHRLPSCCAAMRDAMVPTDEVLNSPEKGYGATLRVRYDIPRPDSPPEVRSVDADDTSISVSTARFQRIGSQSNTQVGRDFEDAAVAALKAAGVDVQKRFAASVGVGALRKRHRFDLGSADPPILVECKSHRWTSGGNVPSAKLTVWNEAMYYFAIAPLGFRKIFFVLRDYSDSRKITLADHYLARYRHMVPEDVEFWEYDEVHQSVRIIKPHVKQRIPIA